MDTIFHGLDTDLRQALASQLRETCGRTPDAKASTDRATRAPMKFFQQGS